MFLFRQYCSFKLISLVVLLVYLFQRFFLKEKQKKQCFSLYSSVPFFRFTANARSTFIKANSNNYNVANNVKVKTKKNISLMQKNTIYIIILVYVLIVLFPSFLLFSAYIHLIKNVLAYSK